MSLDRIWKGPGEKLSSAAWVFVVNDTWTMSLSGKAGGCRQERVLWVYSKEKCHLCCI
jgi:hypothetical protein